MAKKIKNGPVTIEVPDHLVPPKGAGSLSPEQVKGLVKPRLGIGVACEAAADAMENGDLGFTAPKGVTPDLLRKAGKRAEDMDLIVQHIAGLLEMFKQANLMVDAEAFELVSKVNDQVKVQGKRNKAVTTGFNGLITYFKRSPASKKKQKAGG